MAKNGFVAMMDELPRLIKILLALPALDIIWAIYRIVKGVTQNKLLVLLFGVLWIVPGAVICWVVDMVSIIIVGKPVVFA